MEDMVKGKSDDFQGTQYESNKIAENRSLNCGFLQKIFSTSGYDHVNYVQQITHKVKKHTTPLEWYAL
jgi:hypothetical protein